MHPGVPEVVMHARSHTRVDTCKKNHAKYTQKECNNAKKFKEKKNHAKN